MGDTHWSGSASSATRSQLTAAVAAARIVGEVPERIRTRRPDTEAAEESIDMLLRRDEKEVSPKP